MVIGGGAAGLMAASVAAKRGLKVTLISRGKGSTYLSTGCLDVLGYSPSDGRFIDNPARWIQETVNEINFHPYSLLSREPAKTLNEAMNFFIKQASEMGLKYEGSLDKNIWVINNLGTVKPTCFALGAVFKGNLEAIKDENVLIVGIREFPLLFADYVVESLKKIISAMGLPFPRSLQSCYISLPGVEKQLVNHSHDFNEVILSKLHTELEKNLKSRKITCIGIPPILELDELKWLEKEEKILGVRIFEIIMHSSMHGKRLQAVLEKIALSSGVVFLKDYRAIQAVLDGNKCREIIISTHVRTFNLEAKVFVLATGDILGDGIGIEGDAEIVEPVFQLKLGGAEKFEELKKYLNHEPFPERGHPLFKIGVTAGYGLNVAHGEGVFLENVFAAGSVLGGYDYCTEKSGLGVALSTGYMAGHNAYMYAGAK